VPGNVTPFSGNVVLSWFPEKGVNNDNFLAAQQLSGSAGSLAATNAGATKETGEPNHADDRGGRSVWYTWTAPFSGQSIEMLGIIGKLRENGLHHARTTHTRRSPAMRV
jgi:hypothetical protein